MQVDWVGSPPPAQCCRAPTLSPRETCCTPLGANQGGPAGACGPGVCLPAGRQSPQLQTVAAAQTKPIGAGGNRPLGRGLLRGHLEGLWLPIQPPFPPPLS